MHIVKVANKDDEHLKSQTIIKEDVDNQKYYLFTKRCLDILGASFGIILLLFVFVIIAILIKGEDRRGPVFFKQNALEKWKRILHV